MIPDDLVFNTIAMKLLKEAEENSFQNTTSSTMTLLPTIKGKHLSNTESEASSLAIIISSICGTIAILTITIAVAWVKYLRWRRSRSTESKLWSDSHITLNEAHENNPRGSNEAVFACQNDQSTQDSNQSLQVCQENPYLPMSERAALRDKTLLEEKNTSSYVQMTRSETGDLDDENQALRDGMTKGEIDQIPQSTDVSHYEEFASNRVAETVEPCQHMIEVHIGNVSNDFPVQSSVENTIVNNGHTNCNTTI